MERLGDVVVPLEVDALSDGSCISLVTPSNTSIEAKIVDDGGRCGLELRSAGVIGDDFSVELIIESADGSWNEEVIEVQVLGATVTSADDSNHSGTTDPSSANTGNGQTAPSTGSPPETLAFTGAESSALAVGGVSVFLFGGVLLLVSRRPQGYELRSQGQQSTAR